MFVHTGSPIRVVKPASNTFIHNINEFYLKHKYIKTCKNIRKTGVFPKSLSVSSCHHSNTIWAGTCASSDIYSRPQQSSKINSKLNLDKKHSELYFWIVLSGIHLKFNSEAPLEY